MHLLIKAAECDVGESGGKVAHLMELPLELGPGRAGKGEERGSMSGKWEQKEEGECLMRRAG